MWVVLAGEEEKNCSSSPEKKEIHNIISSSTSFCGARPQKSSFSSHCLTLFFVGVTPEIRESESFGGFFFKEINCILQKYFLKF